MPDGTLGLNRGVGDADSNSMIGAHAHNIPFVLERHLCTPHWSSSLTSKLHDWPKSLISAEAISIVWNHEHR